MTITIPFSGDSEATAPLQRCITKAADEMGVSEFHVALLMSYFFEQVCEEVGKNRLVRIPGFGAFGPKVWTPRHDRDAPAYAYPAFVAAPAFQNLVRDTCPADGPALQAIDDHRRHNHPSSHKDRSSRMPFSTQKAFRVRVRAQARRLGFET